MPILEKLKGGLIASCQPVAGGPMDRPEIVAAMAAACVAGGAAGLRVEGIANLRAVRAVVDVPIIGIVKTDLPDSPVRITVALGDVAALRAAGADVIAYDATPRPRPDDRDRILQAILASGALAMADCATRTDALAALAGGAQILGTTLAGYTEETGPCGDGPDLALVRAFAGLGAFVMAEGRYNSPDLAAAAMAAGADAVTVGSALTRLEIMTGWFARAVKIRPAPPKPDQPDGFAIDLGGTKIAAARFAGGKVVAQLRDQTDGQASAQALVTAMAGLVTQLGYRFGAPLGVAVAGRVDMQGRWQAVNRATLSGVEDIDLGALVAARLGPAQVMNDAAAATLAEQRLGAGRGLANFAFITVSTGVGGGLVLNGRLHRSADGIAGHLGFQASSFGSEPCGSGRLGTVESVASGRAIALAAARAGHAGLDARAVFAAAEANADWAVAILDRSAAAIAELCADLRITLGLEAIALGGSVGFAPGYVERVRRALSDLPEVFRCPVIRAETGPDGPMIGALCAAQTMAETR